MYQVRQKYSRRQDIHMVHGGQQQGGISTPTKAPLIFLYTGEGQYGRVTFS